MRRRGFLAGLLAAPVMLKFAGALSPKDVVQDWSMSPAAVEAGHVSALAVSEPAMFEVGDLICVGGCTDLFRITKVSDNGDMVLEDHHAGLHRDRMYGRTAKQAPVIHFK